MVSAIITIWLILLIIFILLSWGAAGGVAVTKAQAQMRLLATAIESNGHFIFLKPIGDAFRARPHLQS